MMMMMMMMMLMMMMLIMMIIIMIMMRLMNRTVEGLSEGRHSIGQIYFCDILEPVEGNYSCYHHQQQGPNQPNHYQQSLHRLIPAIEVVSAGCNYREETTSDSTSLTAILSVGYCYC